MEETKLKYLLAFYSLPEIGSGRLQKILEIFPSLKKAWQAPDIEYHRACSISQLDKKAVTNILKNRSKVDPAKEYQKFLDSGVEVIDQTSEKFPTRLLEIPDPPIVLFYKGNIDLLNKKQLAVVGTRMPTEYGQMVAKKLVTQLANAGLVITSGMALGIDRVAHSLALKASKPTVAVLGAGINQARTVNNGQRFMQQILEGNGLVVSEYPPNVPGTKFTFPARNRIISGLSLGVLVIEAGQKSGTLITANHALEQNREVFAVPGNIFSAKSAGTHELIKQGAKLTDDINDILESLSFARMENDKKEEKKVNLEDPIEQQIYNSLSYDPITIDKLAKSLKLDSSLISAKLSLLELRSLVKNIGGGRFVKQ